jgi:hypothetical protein
VKKYIILIIIGNVADSDWPSRNTQNTMPTAAEEIATKQPNIFISVMWFA